jgi:hypothetical protein
MENSHNDANAQFRRPPQIAFQWFFIALSAFAILDYYCVGRL